MKRIKESCFRIPQMFVLSVVMVMVACFTGCAAAGPRPPIRLPFAVHQTGATVSSEVRIVKHGAYRYPFFLVFPFKDNEERERIRKLLGSGSKKILTGEYAEPGIPINLKITISIIEPSGERILSEQEVSTVGIQSTSVSGFMREIEEHHFRMSPGLYRVTVENLKGIPEFKDIKVVFVIYTLRNV